MRKNTARTLTAMFLLSPAVAHAAAAVEPTQAQAPNAVTYATADEVRVVALPTGFSVFWRENKMSVHNAEIGRTEGIARKLVPCALPAMPPNSPNELGYDVAANGANYSIVFSSVALGAIHRGSGTFGVPCQGAPDAALQSPASGVRLSRDVESPKAMAFHAAVPTGFTAFVDIEGEDGKHTTIPSRFDGTSGFMQVNPSFVGGKTALLLVPTSTGLLAQTFDTTLAVAIDPSLSPIVQGDVKSAVGFPDAEDGSFRILYTTARQIFEGHLKKGVFEKVQLVSDVPLVLKAATLDPGNEANPLAFVAEDPDAGRPVFVRPRYVDGKAQRLLVSDLLTLQMEGFQGGASVACLDKVCVVAQANNSGRVELTRISEGKVEPLESVATTSTTSGGRNGSSGGTGLPTEPTDDASTTSSGCSVHGDGAKSGALGFFGAVVASCLVWRRKRTPAR